MEPILTLEWVLSIALIISVPLGSLLFYERVVRGS